jgi:hypothetical protein
MATRNHAIYPQERNQGQYGTVHPRILTTALLQSEGGHILVTPAAADPGGTAG